MASNRRLQILSARRAESLRQTWVFVTYNSHMTQFYTARSICAPKSTPILILPRPSPLTTLFGCQNSNLSFGRLKHVAVWNLCLPHIESKEGVWRRRNVHATTELGSEMRQAFSNNVAPQLRGAGCNYLRIGDIAGSGRYSRESMISQAKCSQRQATGTNQVLRPRYCSPLPGTIDKAPRLSSLDLPGDCILRFHRRFRACYTVCACCDCG